MIFQEYPILFFKTVTEFEQWMVENHDKIPGIWVRFFKKNSGVKSLVYSEALDVALCYGWIDSQVKKYDADSYIQKFTPRRSKSIWSDINRGHIARLIKEGRMKPAGLVQVELAKKDGRWDAAYGSPTSMKPPEDFLKELHKNKKATQFFEGLNKANTYAIAFQIHTAKKEETKKRRIEKFIAMLARGEKLY